MYVIVSLLFFSFLKWWPRAEVEKEEGRLIAAALSHQKQRFHRIIKSFRLKKITKIKSNPQPITTMPTKPYPSVPYLPLNTSKNCDSSTSLGTMFQCFPTLSEKKFFLNIQPEISGALPAQLSSHPTETHWCTQWAPSVNPEWSLSGCVCRAELLRGQGVPHILLDLFEASNHSLCRYWTIPRAQSAFP